MIHAHCDGDVSTVEPPQWGMVSAGEIALASGLILFLALPLTFEKASQHTWWAVTGFSELQID
jgi:hypothetical protein